MAENIRQRMGRYLRADIQKVAAYPVISVDCEVKIDLMENPFRLETHLQHELGRRLAAVAVNRYPSSEVKDLKERLSNYLKVPEGCSLLLGNGSDELIALLSVAFRATARSAVLAAEPTFVMYKTSALLHGMQYVGVSLTPAFELDVGAMLSAIDEYDPALIYIPYPNNPTANLWSQDAIDAIITKARGFVIIDEAYQPFASCSLMSRLEATHVLIMGTLSKFGLAGARVGYLVGNSDLMAELEKVRPPFNVSALNATAAIFALDYLDVYEKQWQEIVAGRRRLSTALSAIRGVEAFASDANMVLIRVPDASLTYSKLISRGVLVKNVGNNHSLLRNCLRITVGTPDEVTRTISELQLAV